MTAQFDSMGQFTDTVAGDVRDPYPELARKRAETPVELSMQMGFDLQEGLTATVYRYDDVDTVLRDNETYSSSSIRELMAVVMGPYVLVGMDEPEHKRHRHLVSHAFRSKALAHWEDDLITDVVDGLIDGFAGLGRAELVARPHLPLSRAGDRGGARCAPGGPRAVPRLRGGHHQRGR